MINPATAYAEAGKRAALAMNQRDQARFDLENRWYRLAKALEDDSGKLVASQAFEESYRENRNIPPVEYFK